MRILCIGDPHIGRRSSKIPEDLDGKDFSCSGAWERAVRYAVEQEVDLVALSGDLVDRKNMYYEALGPLERGLRELADAGIETCAVAGNHDFDVLPRLARALGSSRGGSRVSSREERFHLVGRGGEWERVTIERDGRPVLHVDGCSFPKEHGDANPKEKYDLPPAEGEPRVPVLGLLHADVGAATGPYAPVALKDLLRRKVDVWVLGHGHAGRILNEDAASGPVTFYTGSPQAMDPGETGAHGAWLLDLSPSRSVTGRAPPKLVPLSTARYEGIEIDVTDVSDGEELDGRVLKVVREGLDAFAEGPGPLRHVSYRLRLTGRTAFHRELKGRVASLVEDFQAERGDVSARVERVENLTRPAVDLAELARGSDVVGSLAGVLLELMGPRRIGDEECAGNDGGESECDALVEDALERMAAVHAHKTFAEGELRSDPAPDAETARAKLVEQGFALLDVLVAQKTG